MSARTFNHLLGADDPGTTNTRATSAFVTCAETSTSAQNAQLCAIFVQTVKSLLTKSKATGNLNMTRTR
ncbi:hypothetical protein P7_292 [Pectobacterium phage vB_PcaM_P7_Pc]|nr:hypothetical protein P7_292 [Pectobacterium phage vB_PcaM_P7_Pc]